MDIDQQLQALIDHGVPVKIDLHVEFPDGDHWVMEATLDDKHKFKRIGDDLDEVESALTELLDFAREIQRDKP